MRFLGRLLVIVVILALTPVFLGDGPAGAQSSERVRQIDEERKTLQQKINEADQKAKSISGEIAANSSRKFAVERDISRLTLEIALAEKRIAQAEAELGLARTELHAVEETLGVTLKRVDEMKDRLDNRAASTYKHGTGIYLEMLISSEDFRSFLNRLSYVRGVISEDRSRLKAVERLSDQLTKAREQVTQRRDGITAQKVQIEEEKAEVARRKGQLQSARNELSGLINQGHQNLQQVKTEKAAYLKAMEQLKRESSSIAAMLRSRQKGQVWQAGGGKKLAWPCTGSTTSSYGYRTHPIFQDRRFHSGIDIGCKPGAPVISAEAGTVVWAGTRSGYGLTVIVDHGSALATLYAHLSSVSVGSGSKVSRGQNVGTVGCSGYCTGPHLHFETRINGDPVDPMQFYR